MVDFKNLTAPILKKSKLLMASLNETFVSQCYQNRKEMFLNTTEARNSKIAEKSTRDNMQQIADAMKIGLQLIVWASVQQFCIKIIMTT